MHSRKDIERRSEESIRKDDVIRTARNYSSKEIVEVLLDIRDILIHNAKGDPENILVDDDESLFKHSDANL